MHLLYVVSGFLWLSANFTTGESITDAVIYEKLEILFRNCTQHLPLCENQSPSSNRMFRCDCDNFCTLHNMCCLNSPYRHFKISVPKPSCRTFNDLRRVEIMDKCPLGAIVDKEVSEKCEKEFDVYQDDLKLFIPVTSLSTNMTYKNYFCFRCFEAHQDYLYWHARFVSFTQYRDYCNEDVPVYNSGDKAWMAPFGKKGEFVPLDVEIEIPAKLSERLRDCSRDIVADCPSQWRDGEVRQMCKAYTSLVYFWKRRNGESQNSQNIRRDYTVYYKNPHCALCNFEILDGDICTLYVSGRGGGYDGSGGLRSLVMLIDINGEFCNTVGYICRCPPGEVWDAAFDSCKTITCALDYYVWKDGECSPA